MRYYRDPGSSGRRSLMRFLAWFLLGWLMMVGIAVWGGVH